VRDGEPLLRIYYALLKKFGHRGWWPGETRFEVMVGAILTQNTSWRNVEKAIAGLKQRGLLTPRSLATADLGLIENAIRSSGFYKQKAERLKLFAHWLMDKYDGELDLLFAVPLQNLRKELLSLKGIGPETVDSILLYAGNKPVFVIDAYTRRIFWRLGLTKEDAKYDELQEFFESCLPHDVELFKDYHAQIVELGKTYCRKKPLCAGCPLRAICKNSGIGMS